MRTIIAIFLLLASWFAFGFYDRKKTKDIISDLEKTKAILNIDCKGEELKKVKLEEQVEEILKVHKTKQGKVKRSLRCMLEDDRIEEIFE